MISPTQGNGSIPYRDQRQPGGERQRLGSRQTDQKGTGESRRIDHRDGVQVAEPDPGAAERLVDHRKDPLQVGARGDFGNDAAVNFVDFHLRGDYRPEHIQPVIDDRRGGFVTARFNRQYFHAAKTMFAKVVVGFPMAGTAGLLRNRPPDSLILSESGRFPRLRDSLRRKSFFSARPDRCEKSVSPSSCGECGLFVLRPLPHFITIPRISLFFPSGLRGRGESDTGI